MDEIKLLPSNSKLPELLGLIDWASGQIADACAVPEQMLGEGKGTAMAKHIARIRRDALARFLGMRTA